MKKENDIIWRNISFKEHMLMNTHWELQGIIDDKRRFLMFCNKDVIVWLHDLKTDEKIEVPFGSQLKGKNIALDILEKENKK